MTCDHCGKTFEKTPRKVGKFNYCGWACSRAAHGAKITGANHPNWRGGAIAGRGPSWHKTRTAVINRQAGRCADCGMTNEAHRARYGAGLHVHHRSPYRLALDNSPDNLIAVCMPCHGKEEAATRRAMSPEDFAAMRNRSDHDRALGFHRDDFARMYDACPTCGTRKAKKSALCRACSNRAKREASGRLVCAECGGPKANPRAACCWACHVRRLRAS